MTEHERALKAATAWGFTLGMSFVCALIIAFSGIAWVAHLIEVAATRCP